MKFLSILTLSLVLPSPPAIGQSVFAPGQPEVGAQAAALERQRAMATQASRLGSSGGTQGTVRKQADWQVVAQEWSGTTVSQSQLSGVAGQPSGAPAGNASSGRIQTENRASSNTSGATSRASARTSIGSQTPNRVRVGSTVINVKTGDVSTTAKYGDAVTNIGTRDGGSGSARIDVRAGEVVTDATGGDATTNIGAKSGSGTSRVVTGTTITRARGGKATTNIGNGNGVVSSGFTYNEGGTLTIGASGISRNGRKCIEIFRQTCIVHIYIRRKSDPCAPGYWISFRRCLLPSDLIHKIRE